MRKLIFVLACCVAMLLALGLFASTVRHVPTWDAQPDSVEMRCTPEVP